MLTPFPGYDFVEKHSPEIFVAACVSNPPTLFHPGTDRVNTYPIEIVASIKGTNQPGHAVLQSLHWLNIGDSYLIFGHARNEAYVAFEEYRVVPLGRPLFLAGEITNSIAGKPEDEQLQILFKRALDHASSQIKELQDEKQQLEGAVRK